MPPTVPLNPPARPRPPLPAQPKPAPRPFALEGLPDGFKIADSTPRLNSEDLKLPDGTPMVGPNGYLVPEARSFSMVVNSATRVFSYRFDEAMRDNFVNARAMRRDAFIRGLLEERILPTINRKWQLEVDDDKHPDQKLVRDSLYKIVQATPQFDAFKRALLDAVWFGRAGAQWSNVRNAEVDNLWTLRQWDPVHGDSIQYTFDGKPAILLDAMTAGWYATNGATRGPFGDLRPTDRGGTALVLQRPYWRDRFAIHQHMREKADYFEGELAGSVQGLGLRGLVYWHYVIRTEALTWMLTYMQAVGQMDLLVFNYPQGDADAKQNAMMNARKIIGKAAMACPRNPTGNWAAVEQIPMNDAGLKALHDLIADYFDRHIERLIVGQSMSSGADNESGLGGTGRAEFARATKDEILVYDTNRLDETITTDVLRPLKRANFPWANFPVRYKSVMPDLEAKDKVASGETLIKNRVPIKMDEFREAAGYSRPEKGDELVPGEQQQAPGGMPGMPGQPPPGGPGGPQPGQQPPGGDPWTANTGGKPPAPAERPAEPPGTYPRSLPPEPSKPPTPVGSTPHSRYEGGPAAGPGTVPSMGYPGGGNTYLPDFGRRRKDEPVVGFTRYDDSTGRWVTMPANGEGGGGTPVHIENGVITKGPAGMVGNPPDRPRGERRTGEAGADSSARRPSADVIQKAVQRLNTINTDRVAAETGYPAQDVFKVMSELGMGPRPPAGETPPAAPQPPAESAAAPKPKAGTFGRIEEAAQKLAGAWEENERFPGYQQLKFRTRSKREFTITASTSRHAGTEITFEDDSGSYRKTGMGEAHEVFTNVLAGLSLLVAEKKPPMMSFSASGESRQRLYDRLAKSMLAQHPEYVAYAGYITSAGPVNGGARRNTPTAPPTAVESGRLYFVVNRNDPQAMAGFEKIRGRGYTLESLHASRYARGEMPSAWEEIKPATPDELAFWNTPEAWADEDETPADYARNVVPVPYGKYGCLMAPLTGEAAMAVLRAGALIADEDLAADGRCTDPHVTVRYGFHADVTEDDVRAAVAGFGPAELRLGAVSVFENVDADVVKFTVESADLRRLRGLTAKLPHTDTHPEYKPHATIAYVKPGLGRVYAERLAAADLNWTVDDLDFKPAD